jgi:hypothetical protein
MEGSPIGDGAPEAMDAVAVHDHTGAENRWIADGLAMSLARAIVAGHAYVDKRIHQEFDRLPVAVGLLHQLLIHRISLRPRS